MKKLTLAILAILLLITSLAARTTNPPLQPRSEFQPKLQKSKPRKPGRWFMAEDGHAVYCYGPVITINVFLGEPKQAATQCRGSSAVVPLHD